MIEVRHSESISPDGRFRAESKRQWIVGLVPSMPGQGSEVIHPAVSRSMIDKRVRIWDGFVGADGLLRVTDDRGRVVLQQHGEWID
jgi:hypothetical protein